MVVIFSAQGILLGKTCREEEATRKSLVLVGSIILKWIS
jgi:hypothetical protein